MQNNFTDEQLKEIEIRVQKAFEDCDGCCSCGWHSAYFEAHEDIWPEILDRNNWDKERDRFEIPCNSKDDDYPDTHRGYRLYGYDKIVLEKQTPIKQGSSEVEG